MFKAFFFEGCITCKGGEYFPAGEIWQGIFETISEARASFFYFLDRSIEMKKTIEEYPLYQVNEHGEVFGPRGKLNGWISSTGYRMVSLTNDNGSVQKFVHRLVAEAFCDGRTELRNVVDHIDGDKVNNDASNLRWCTQGENVRYAMEAGRFPEGRMPIPVIVKNVLTGETAMFSSIWEASRKCGLPYWHLNEILHEKGYRKTTYGYTVFPA